MSANWRQNGNWPNRLKDWEQRGAGPLPGDDLWGKIEADLPPPRKKRILPVWWLLLFGGILGLTLILWPRKGELAQRTDEQPGLVAPPPTEASLAYALPEETEKAEEVIMEGEQDRLREATVATPQSTSEEKFPNATTHRGEADLVPSASYPAPERLAAEGAGQWPDRKLPSNPDHYLATGRNLAPALRGPEKLPEVPLAAKPVPPVATPTRAFLKVDGISPLPMYGIEKLAVSQPSVPSRPVTPGKFTPVSTTVPGTVQLSAGIIRMRTEVKTPPGVELSPVDRGERFETGNGSFLALGWQKGRFGLSAAYREQPQSNQYFTRRQLNFDQSREENSPDGLRTSTYELEAKDGFSESTLEIEIKRSSNTHISEQDILRVEVRTDQELDVRSVPLLVHYEQPLGRLFSLRLGAGLSFNELRLAQSRTLTRVQLSTGQILAGNRLLRGQSASQKFDYWALHTQAGFFLAPRDFPLSLGVGIDLSRSLGDWWPQRPDGRWLETRGLSVMAGFRF
ncbi:hypothetical protein [Lewinella sp. W8]|uniref:hypothetical protein n=1 Tax=Lewinella sp. W8 TaxID=2528208 RepID=UPI001068750F|nr:hypothetical protein [Lewinella sp. W8]MTB52288.1 hypothetical protein [Lewinella sp. W8]